MGSIRRLVDGRPRAGNRPGHRPDLNAAPESHAQQPAPLGPVDHARLHAQLSDAVAPRAITAADFASINMLLLCSLHLRISAAGFNV